MTEVRRYVLAKHVNVNPWLMWDGEPCADQLQIVDAAAYDALQAKLAAAQREHNDQMLDVLRNAREWMEKCDQLAGRVRNAGRIDLLIKHALSAQEPKEVPGE